MATIKDVAKLAGVSVSTVSYSLNGNSKVSVDTRRRVLEAAERLRYHKNGMASDLKSSRTDTIALIIDDLAGPFFSEFIRGVQATTYANGYSLIACSSVGGRDSTGVKFIREKRADGVIVFAHNIDSSVVFDSARTGFPVVLVDRDVTTDDIISVSVDNFQGGCLATEHLIKNGHRDIAYISGATGSYDNDQRFQGYQVTLQKYGLKPHSSATISGSFTKEGGYMATKMLIAQGGLPTAAFFANDEMAIGGINAFIEEGIRIPEQVSIIGYDDITLAEYTNPRLTTIRQPKYEMGSLAAHLLLRVFAGEEVKRHYKLSAELIMRESCATRL